MNNKDIGDKGESIILAEAITKGYIVSIPFGDNSKYDLVIDRGLGLEKIQVKYHTGDGEEIRAICKYNRGYDPGKYTKNDIDAIIVYDSFTKKSYYIPAEYLGEGRNTITLRLKPTKNNQEKGIVWAKDFEIW